MRNDGPALVVAARPDGYVAAWGTPQCMTRVTAYLREVLGNRPGSAQASTPGGVMRIWHPPGGGCQTVAGC
jgi:hypothetical protein